MVPGVSGAIVTLMIRTIAVIGRTETSDSRIFSCNDLLCRKKSPLSSQLHDEQPKEIYH